MAENILGNAANAQGKEDKYSGGFLKGFVMNNLMARSAQKSIDGGGSPSSGGVTAAQASGPTAPSNIVFGGKKAMSRRNENYREQLRIHREEVLDPYHARTQEAADNDVIRGEVRDTGAHNREVQKLGIQHKFGEQSKNNAFLRNETALNTAVTRQQPPAAAVARNRGRTTTGTDRAARVAPTLPAGAKSAASDINPSA
jgi:hypothetical protein